MITTEHTLKNNNMLTIEQRINIEQQILSPQFYRCNFIHHRAAAAFLGIPEDEWRSFFREIDESLHNFLYTMRVEDVKEHLQRHPREPLRILASIYGFASVFHLLWHFYKREKYTPRSWAVDNGLIPE